MMFPFNCLLSSPDLPTLHFGFRNHIIHHFSLEGSDWKLGDCTHNSILCKVSSQESRLSDDKNPHRNSKPEPYMFQMHIYYKSTAQSQSSIFLHGEKQLIREYEKLSRSPCIVGIFEGGFTQYLMSAYGRPYAPCTTSVKGHDTAFRQPSQVSKVW